MRIAMPVWQGRISPVFDAAKHLLVYCTEEGGRRTSFEVCMGEDPPANRTMVLAAHAVDVLICGGISTELKEHLEAAGTEVICWVKGEPQHVLQAYLSEDLDNPRFEMPGRERTGRPVSAVSGQGPA